MKRFIKNINKYFLLLILIYTFDVIAQDERPLDEFVFVGIKVGYLLTPDSMYNYGFEISHVNEFKRDANTGFSIFYGSYLDLDFGSGFVKLHFGIEALGTFELIVGSGLALGPTFLFGIDEPNAGISFIPFISLPAFVPYFNFTIFADRIPSHDLGVYLKFPISSKNSMIGN